MLPSNCRARLVDRLGNVIEAESLLIWCNFAILPTVALCAGYDVAVAPVALLLASVSNCGHNAFPHIRALAHADRITTFATLACDLHMFFSGMGGSRRAASFTGIALLACSVLWCLRRPLCSAAVDCAVWRLLLYVASWLLAWAYVNQFEHVMSRYQAADNPFWPGTSADYMWL
eukprot:GGOE01014459.1.p1 GENE.GGOE01014459.1~~GGOE01014459.1.p1  ORF type:complete len:174 (+),score=15.14 GGOE01014459.1:88-609(+)